MTNYTFERWWNNLDQRPVLAVMLSSLWLVFIGGFAFFWHLGSTGLIDETEPLFAEASRQMHLTGDWITPYFNGVTRFDKPALIYWCQAIAYQIFGVNEWAVRLPSAIAALAVISLVFYTVQWQQGVTDVLDNTSRPQKRWLTAALASAIAALNPEMIVWARTGVSDMLLTGCIASALLCFFMGYAEKPRGNSLIPSPWYLAFYILIAGAILTKGPVGIVLPGLIIAAFLIYVGKFWQVLREMGIILGILIISALSLPWYILVTQRNGWSFINSFFGYHNIERFTEVVNGHGAPWYFYFIVVLLGFAPYAVYLPVAIANSQFWQRRQWQNQPRQKQFRLFTVFWFLGVFSFFTIAVTKLPSYVLPLMPAAGILVAFLFGEYIQEEGIPEQQKATTGFRISAWINVIFLTAVAVALFYLHRLLGTEPAAPQFPESLHKSGLPVTGTIIWLVCGVILSGFILQRQWRLLMDVNLIGFLLFLVFVLTPALFLYDQQAQLPLRQLSATISQVQKPQEEVMMVGFRKPTIVFYSQRNVNYFKLSSKAGNYVREQAAKQKLPSSLLLLAQPKKFSEMGLKSSDYQKISSRGVYQLVRVSLGGKKGKG
ncbi:ArnT family glycosyltransferase [Calothrix sp. 336/3]|uniref:ArnT family glycosyltransferase n=1 Tax=Calothrix sp. 336/3 TaxID=1337936 RepID=UPI0004E3BD15|nr:glycosyltransferase family 39 protein [Calothrix sp. 336/3]AKG23079.1 glycosyltransferase [Calothrix sp. 336/3]